MNRKKFRYSVSFTNGESTIIECYWSPDHPCTRNYAANAAAAMQSHTSKKRVEAAAPASLID